LSECTPASTEEQGLKFSIKVVNKTAASTIQFSYCILLHAYSCTTAAPICTSRNKNFISLFNKLHNSKQIKNKWG